MSVWMSHEKLREQVLFLSNFAFGYTDEYVQMLTDQVGLRDERIHRLEHALMTCRNFMHNPGDNLYAQSIYATVEELLDI